MREDVESVSPIALSSASRPHLRPARFDDYDQIVSLEQALNSQPTSQEDWRELWAGNPLWDEVCGWWPIGWVLETPESEIVGSLGNIPLLYHFRGERIIAASGRGWVVAPEYRGFALWLLDERFNQPGVDLFMDTTISPLALDAFNEFSNRIPAGDWETIAYWVTGYRAFATRALQQLNVPKALAPATAAGLRFKDFVFGSRLPKPHPSFTIGMTDRFNSDFDVFWEERLRQNHETLLAARDCATLSWHFSLAMRRDRLWIFTASRGDHMQAYCILKRQSHVGKLARMRLVDYQTLDPGVDLLPDFIRAALRRCAAEDICILDKPGTGLFKMRTFDEFAPYRARQTWPLFYRAVNAAFAEDLRDAKVWDPSAYDGDASIE